MFYEQVDDTRAQRFNVSSQYVASGQLRTNIPSGAHVTNWLQDVQAWKSPSDGQAVNIDTQVPMKEDTKIQFCSEIITWMSIYYVDSGK